MIKDFGNEATTKKLKQLLDEAPRRYKLEAYIPTACQVFAEHPNWSRDKWAEEISRRIAKDPSLADCPHFPPSSRTAGNWYEDIYKKLSDEERQGFDLYRWPDAHQNGSLPWEASTIGLELLRFYNLEGLAMEPPRALRLGISQVRWAHYLLLAAPDLPLFTTPDDDGGHVPLAWSVESLSYDLMQMEHLGRHPDGYVTEIYPSIPSEERATFQEVVADYLVWKPWLSPENYRAYYDLSTVKGRGPSVLIGRYKDEDGAHRHFTIRSLTPYVTITHIGSHIVESHEVEGYWETIPRTGEPDIDVVQHVYAVSESEEESE